MLSKHGAHVTGIDQSQEMVNRAQDKYPHLAFLQRDVTRLEYHGVFDAVFSNATLHWILSPKEALTRIYEALKQEGRFVAEFGGAGNVAAIMGAVENEFLARGLTYSSPWYFPSIGQYTSLMEEVGFKVSFAELFDRPTPLEGKDGLKDWLHMFGGTLFAGMTSEDKENIIATVEEKLKPTLCPNGQWIADYKRIRVIAHR